MKRLPIIVLTLALCLLTAGCGAKPNEPDDGDSAKAGIVERMATVKAEEIKYISSFFSREHVSAEDMASVLNAAAEHHGEQPGQGLDHYTMEIYLSGGPDAYSSSDEHFVFFAGLDENHINGIYFNGKGDSSSMSFEDETLYWLIRNSYRTEEHVDKDAMHTTGTLLTGVRSDWFRIASLHPERISSPAMRLCSFIKKKSLRTKAAATRSIVGNPRFWRILLTLFRGWEGCTSMPTAESAPMSSTPIL